MVHPILVASVSVLLLVGGGVMGPTTVDIDYVSYLQGETKKNVN